MATPVEIIDKALLDTHTDSADYDPSTDGIEALNIVSSYVNNTINQNVREDYFWDSFTVNTVIGQSEYNITSGLITWDGVPSTSVNIKKVNKVFIKYDSTSDYRTRAYYQSPDMLDQDFEYYEDNQSKSEPFFYVQDRSIFVYPAPDAVVTGGLKMTAIYEPPEISYASAESFLPLQKDKHYIYSLGMEWQIYKSQGKINESNNAKAIFDKELITLTTYLKTRKKEAVIKTTGDLSAYK